MTRSFLAASAVLLAVVLVLSADAAPPPVPSLGMWSYTLIAPGTAPPDFPAPGPTPPGWGTGVAPFTNDHPASSCSFPPGATYFPENLELLARKTFFYDGWSPGVNLEFVADGHVAFFVNNVEVHRGFYENCAVTAAIFVPWTRLAAGPDNLLVAQVVDTGGFSYFDTWILPSN